jgi:hypothetical protein
MKSRVFRNFLHFDDARPVSCPKIVALLTQPFASGTFRPDAAVSLPIYFLPIGGSDDTYLVVTRQAWIQMNPRLFFPRFSFAAPG